MQQLRSLFKQNQATLIGLMVIAMIGLISFQWNWIQHAIALKQSQFDKNVADALQETVRKIERQEIAYLAQQCIQQAEQEKLAIGIDATTLDAADLSTDEFVAMTDEAATLADEAAAKVDSAAAAAEEVSHQQIEIIIEKVETGKDVLASKNRRLPPEQLEQLRGSQPDKDIAWAELMKKRQNEANEIAAWEKEAQAKLPDDAVMAEAFNERLGSLIAPNRAALLKDVFTDFLKGPRTIYERLNQTMIDTLLQQELQQRGINLLFEYGIRDNSNLIFASYAMNYDPNLLKKAYQVRLFPNDSEPQNQFLYVYFPQKQSFILQNVGVVFGTSLLLVCMIGGIFYVSMNTILRQKKLSEIKNDFISNMTHEFKTPISTISLAVQLLQDKEVKSEEAKVARYLGIIKDENRRLGSQVEKVLQMAQLERGEVNLNWQEVDIHEVIQKVLHTVSVQLEETNGHIDLQLAANQPKVWGDEVHLTNIVYNLLDNATKYATENPTISVRTRTLPDGLQINISDNGIGIAKDEINKIFDKFYRISTGNLHDVKGFGLGLSYVKKMMELHQGQVAVQSKLGEGTTFTLFFPTYQPTTI